jgi:hypothetical protein
MLNKVSKIVALMLLGISVATAQQGRVFSENGGWTQEITGSFAAVKNLHVKLDMGSVRVVGGSQQGISYVIHNHSHTNSEDRARRELDNYKISTYTRGDTARIAAAAFVSMTLVGKPRLTPAAEASMLALRRQTSTCKPAVARLK